ncbi:hypothetical protein MGG_05531 [Pyricularia oryzae 70-15]|uniref:MAC1 interacting protein 1 n=4 Tax=Pyricularia TaxID=48558 RepID=Q8J0Q3_PYRGI|nr:uncharacterized protein MGG_05531 [Pyricularia oryzae 70-15]AAN64312.1 MAC1 interacting protein 1 [Pyricularia grisea]EHA57786.1 hypothetical protein MGG_05531 [Pyricularia oryzae 70-15]KAI7915014.1 hypothetical protein M9X92_008677 [Pyricularia oryzae]KAI7915460.1 hypothetical protein M0657_009043 [Pyricularia oryzae]
MKFNSGLLAGAAVLVAGVATAQDCISVALSAIPSCAQPCFLNGAPTIGCSGTDFKCQCQQQAKMFAAVESCVQKSCPESEFQKTIDGSDKVCTCASGGPASNNAGGAGNTVNPSSFIPGPTSTASPTTTVAAPTGTPSGRPSAVPTAAANMAAVECSIVVGAVGGALWVALGL